MIQLFDTTQELSTIQAIPFSGFVSGIYQQYGHFAVCSVNFYFLLSTWGFSPQSFHSRLCSQQTTQPTFLGQNLQSTVVSALAEFPCLCATFLSLWWTGKAGPGM